MAVQRKLTTKPLDSRLVGFFYFVLFNDFSFFQVAPVVSNKNVRKDILWTCLVLIVAGQRGNNSVLYLLLKSSRIIWFIFLLSMFTF